MSLNQNANQSQTNQSQTNQSQTNQSQEDKQVYRLSKPEPIYRSSMIEPITSPKVPEENIPANDPPIFWRHLPFETETTTYILMSTLDLFMTYILLRTSPQFYESNPIANFFFHNWNIRGMIFFKFAMVTVVILISQIIGIKKPDTARRLLQCATLVVTCVVVYSFTLWLRM